MEAADLLQLIASESDQVDANFEFWLMGSFAVVVAAYAARETLSKQYRHGLVGLYLLFTVGMLAKFWADVDAITYYNELLQTTEFSVDRPSNFIAVIFRVMIYLGGSIGVLLILLGNPYQDSDDS